jgi:hypothetical protein
MTRFPHSVARRLLVSSRGQGMSVQCLIDTIAHATNRWIDVALPGEDGRR